MWPFHKHIWSRRSVDHRRYYNGMPYTFVGSICDCGKTRVKRINGHWRLDDFE